MGCLLYHLKYFWGQFPGTPEEVSSLRGCSVMPGTEVPLAEKTKLPGAALPKGRAVPFPLCCRLLEAPEASLFELPPVVGFTVTPAASVPHSGRAEVGSCNSPHTPSLLTFNNRDQCVVPASPSFRTSLHFYTLLKKGYLPGTTKSFNPSGGKS